jgi:predicted TPR repeat methyltransferase
MIYMPHEDWTELLALAQDRLYPHGRLAFTLEEARDDEVGLDADHSRPLLRPTGRFAHSTAYVATSLEAAGLAVRAVHRVVLRMEWGRPEWGLVYVVGRQEDEEEGGGEDDDDGYTHSGASVGSRGHTGLIEPSAR